MIANVASFVEYFGSIRRRTVQYLKTIPEDKIDWAPKAGDFTCGDIVRHLIAAEQLFAGAAMDGKWQYIGHERGAESTREQLLARLEASHAEVMNRLKGMPDDDLSAQRPSLKGPPIKAWRLLMMLVEHEVHHRSQLAMYLELMGVEPPQIYGMTVEDVIALATG